MQIQKYTALCERTTNSPNLGKYMLKKGDIVELKVPLMFSGYKGKAVVAENQWTESVRLHKVDDQEFRFSAMRHEVSKKRQ